MATAVAGIIPVARPSFGSEEEAAVVNVLRSGWVSQGPRVAEFERNFAAYVGAPEAVAVSSCTTALHLALLAAGIGPDDEVLCPSLSFIATANAIVYVGARPVFVDISPDTYNLDPACLEASITPHTKAILVVHQVGLPAPMGEITEIAERHGLLVIEDAACAVGAALQGRRIGVPHSLMACFSFHPRKVLTTGEGGMITTSDRKLAQRLRCLRQHSMSVSDVTRHSSSTVVTEHYDEVGYNYRMTDLQAAVGIVQLAKLEGMLARRRALAHRYLSQLSGIPWLILPSEVKGARHTYQSFMVRLGPDAPLQRDALMQWLLDRRISTRRGIMAIHREAPYSNPVWEGRLPKTNLINETGLILPLYGEMSDAEQDYVIDCLYNAGR
jgi:perosamine synthetase